MMAVIVVTASIIMMMTAAPVAATAAVMTTAAIAATTTVSVRFTRRWDNAHDEQKEQSGTDEDEHNSTFLLVFLSYFRTTLHCFVLMLLFPKY